MADSNGTFVFMMYCYVFYMLCLFYILLFFLLSTVANMLLIM